MVMMALMMATIMVMALMMATIMMVVTETIFSCGEMGRVLEGTKQASPCRSGETFLTF